MLSIGKLAAGTGGYYTAMVASGAEEYYTGAREAPGRWIGQSAGLLGLDGEVTAEDFAALLEHRDPTTGERVTAARSAPTVVAFDATFCAPKSVSILHSLGDDHVRTEVRDAHDAAVAAAFEVLEGEAARGRRGRGGSTVVEGDGLVAGSFRHRTSRAGDPHLHTHVVIANLVHGPDDRWTALDARPLFHWAKTCGYLYEAQLRHELTARLGVSWTPVTRGIADVDGVPKGVRDEFSTRRREIAAHLEASGFDSAKAAQLAAYQTRKMKDHRSTVETLAEEWQRRADALRFDIDTVIPDRSVPRSVERSVQEPAAVDIDRLFADLAGPDGLTKHRATFGRREVIQAICERLPSGAPVESIIEWSEQFIESPHSILLAGEHRPAIQRRDGRAVVALTDQARFSTPDMLRVEHRLVELALQPLAREHGIVPHEPFEAATSTTGLSNEQYRMVLQLTGYGHHIDVIDGVAGSGKTHALGICNRLWTDAGYQVIGCALAGKAARQLETDARIASVTIDRLLIDLDHPQHGGLRPNSIVVVDEAAMVGTRKLLRLAEHTMVADAKLVLIGDPCQLPEIEAGGAFVGLRDRVTHTGLRHNRRQTAQWERDALIELRTGDTDAAVDAYLDRGRITVLRSSDTARERLVDEWAGVRGTQSAIMLASRRVDVDHLNHLARERLRAGGALGGDEVVLGGRGYTTGDLVLALRNDARLGVLNGTRAVIDRIDTDHRYVDCRTETHERLRLPFHYAEAGELTHGYAMTIHKAQGGTYDRCFVLAGDQLTRESAYTALSRAREGTDVYVISDDPRAEDAHMPEHRDQPIDVFRNTVRRSHAQEMAVDVQEHEPDDGAGIDIGM